MEFYVRLLKVPSFNRMSGLEVATLFANARHIAGNYWCYEGDTEALGFEVTEVSTGAIDSCHPSDYNDDQFADKCAAVFGHDFSMEPSMWKVLNSAA